MSVRLFSCLLTVGSVLAASGCAVFEPIRSTTRSMWKSMSFKPTDQADWTEEEDPAWTRQVGEEARGDQPRETDPDGWFRNTFMSQKARSIERNLGID